MAPSSPLPTPSQRSLPYTPLLPGSAGGWTQTVAKPGGPGQEDSAGLGGAEGCQWPCGLMLKVLQGCRWHLATGSAAQSAPHMTHAFPLHARVGCRPLPCYTAHLPEDSRNCRSPLGGGHGLHPHPPPPSPGPSEELG